MAKIKLAYHVSNIGSSDTEKPYKHKGRENFPYNQHNTKGNEFYIADITMKGRTVAGLPVLNFPLKDINNRSVSVSYNQDVLSIATISCISHSNLQIYM